jgi:RHS repeat-associated protein
MIVAREGGGAMLRLLAFALLSMAGMPWRAAAQTGVSDDRVALPDGPGSVEGLGDNAEAGGNMGLFSYSVPIEMPAGFDGMTPDFSLSYSSGGGASIVGVGFSIATPSIERLTLRGLPDYDADDEFTANGAEQLVRVSTSGDTATYRARFERAFVRYQWHDVGVGVGGYWTAEYPDGRVGYFGATSEGELVPASRLEGPGGQTFRYHLVEVVDVFGHSLRYDYALIDGTPHLVGARWVFTDEDTAHYEAELVYEPRPDTISDAKPGFEELETRRVQTILAYSAGAVRRRYELTYEDEVASVGRSRLAAVESFGTDDTRYDVVFQFGYSRALNGVCEVGNCDQPFVVDMGSLPGGIEVASGDATLVDLNGDSLPDLVETSAPGAHRIFYAQLDAEGRASFDAVPVSSATATREAFRIGLPNVQVLDVDGDGFADLANSLTQEVLCNDGSGDWVEGTCTVGEGLGFELQEDEPGDPNPRGARFVDVDGDRRIDLLRTVGTDVIVHRNTGGGFESYSGDFLGLELDADRVELADLNGDGLLDPVVVDPSGQIHYRIHLGHARWTDSQAMPGPELDESELDLVRFEDLNADGLDDLVIVAGDVVRYALNRSTQSFDAFVTIDSDDVDGSLPTVEPTTTTVLFADMNGSGSRDIVWVERSGEVRYLELFPVPPHLLSRIENGIGSVTEVDYGTSIAHRSADATSWEHRIPGAMNVVDRLDRWVTLTGDENGSGLHEVTEHRYHDAFYDGVEKQMRGFARVEARVLADSGDTQEPGRTVSFFELGEEDPYRAGLLTSQQTFSGEGASERAITESRSSFDDCDVAEVPSDGLLFDVRFVCPTEQLEIVQEGAAAAEWKTLRSTQTHDGYGQVVSSSSHGVVHYGPPEAPLSCGPCERDPDLFGEACGESCIGDESHVETTFVAPGPSTDGQWILGKPSMIRQYGTAGGPATQQDIYYDGIPFVGLPAGLTRGNVTHVTARVRDDSSEIVHVTRAEHDEDGNVIAAIDPNGSIEETTTHRREIQYDTTGLRITGTDVLLETPEGEPYRLRREYTYEPTFDQVVAATAWMIIEGETNLSARNATGYRYDEFGRRIAILQPGDTEEAPTMEYEWVLADPASYVRVRSRSALGGDLDLEEIRCFDGRGRAFQTRTKIEEGAYQVSGFATLNARGAAVRTYRPHVESGAACAASEPADVAFVEMRYDASGRSLSRTFPEGNFDERPLVRFEHGPLFTVQYDEADADPAVVAPETTVTDGLGRVVRVVRDIREGGDGPARPVTTRLHYDSLGRLAAYDDGEGNTKLQHHDLLGRLELVEDPSSGGTTFEHDDAGNIVRTTDMRGIPTVLGYDGANRLVSRSTDGLAPIVYRYDRAADCDPLQCRNGENRLVETTYSLPDELAPFLGAGEGRDELGYDARGRQVHSARILGERRFETTQVFDNVGRSIETLYPDGQTVSYAHDGASRIASIGGFVDEIEYDSFGLIAQTLRADATIETFTHDVHGRPLSRSVAGTGGVYEALRHERDVRGLLVGVVDDTPDTDFPRLDAAYRHDAWQRLIGAELGAGDEVEALAWQYDDVGSLLSSTSSSGAASAAHLGALTYAPEQPGIAVAAEGIDATYDEAGLLSTRAGKAFEWDHLARLERVSDIDDPSIATTYVYGPDERCIAILEGDSLSLFVSGGFEVRDGISRVYPRLEGRIVGRSASSALQSSIYADVAPSSGPDGMITAADARASIEAGEHVARATHRAAARRLLRDAAPGVTHLYGDELRTLTVATRDGELVGRRAFYPFGQLRADEGFVDEHGFTGQERDRTTGLDRFQFRWLDTRMGQWTSPDPAFQSVDASSISSLNQSIGRHRYVENSPVDHFDPNGLRSQHIQRSFGRLRSPNSRFNRFMNGVTRFRAQRGMSRLQTRAETNAHVDSIIAHLSTFRGGSAEVGILRDARAFRFTNKEELRHPTRLGRFFAPAAHRTTTAVREGLAVPRLWPGASRENEINRFVRVRFDTPRLGAVGDAAPQVGQLREFRPGGGTQFFVPHTDGIRIEAHGPFPTSTLHMHTTNNGADAPPGGGS